MPSVGRPVARRIGGGAEKSQDVPPALGRQPRKPDWAAWLKANPPISAKRKLTKEETQAFYDEMRGEL